MPEEHLLETQDDQDNFDFYDDSTPFTPDNLARENKRLAAENAKSGAEEVEGLRKHVDDQGNFKSLKSKMEYSGEDLPRWTPGSPDPKNYPSDADVEFWNDYNSFQETGKFDRGLSPLPDDEFRSQRDSLTRDIVNYRRKAELARANGKPKVAESYDNQARWCERDLDKIPASSREIKAEEETHKLSRETVEQLFDPDSENLPIWDTPRMQHDAAIFLAEHNRRAKKYIRIPLERGGRSGNIEPVKPLSMIKFDLPDEVISRLKSHVYADGQDPHPDKVFRRTWAYLHGSGYAATGKMAHKKASPAKKPAAKKITRHPDNMTQKEYEAMRKRQGVVL